MTAARWQLLRLIACACLAALAYPEASSAQLQLSGFVEYDNLTYFKHLGREKINGRNQGILQLELRHQTGEAAEFFASVEFREDQADASRNRVYLDEAYIDLFAGPFDFRIGKQIFSWGRADGLNPTDNLTGWDLSDLLDTDDEKIGVLAARGACYLGNWMLEAVLEPSFTPSVLPNPRSRWWPPLPERLPNPFYPAAGPPELEARYDLEPPRLPADGVKSLQYALKVSGTLRRWDFSLSWFDGFDDLPGIGTTPAVVPSLQQIVVEIAQIYSRRRAIGADFSTIFSGLGLRGEAAYYLTEDWKGADPVIDDPYLHAVFGLDYTFTRGLAGKDLYVSGQWSQEFQVPDRNTHYRATDLNHAFRRSAIVRAAWQMGAFSQLELEGLYNFEEGDWWVRPNLTWAVVEGLTLFASLDLLGGPEESFFGSYRENRRLQIRLKYDFQAL